MMITESFGHPMHVEHPVLQAKNALTRANMRWYWSKMGVQKAADALSSLEWETIPYGVRDRAQEAIQLTQVAAGTIGNGPAFWTSVETALVAVTALASAWFGPNP